MVDLITGTRSLDIFEAARHIALPVVYAAMRRMCLSHILLGLSKFAEFYEAYADIIPTECRVPCKDVMKVIDAKQIRQFRNKFVAHVMDNDTGRPLDLDSLTRYVEQIFAPDEAAFVVWVHNQHNVFPSTVVSILERVRDELIKAHDISNEEMTALSESS